MAVQAAAGARARLVERRQGQAGQQARPGRVGPLGPPQRAAAGVVEYADLDDDRDHDGHSDLRRQPPGIADGDHGPQQEPEQIAGKQQRRDADAARAEPSQVGAGGQDQRQQAQGQDAMTRDGKRQGHDRDHRYRQDQHADDLIPGLRVLHGYRRRQPDDAA